MTQSYNAIAARYSMLLTMHTNTNVTIPCLSDLYLDYILEMNGGVTVDVRTPRGETKDFLVEISSR